MSLPDSFLLQQEILNFGLQVLCILTVHFVSCTDISGPAVFPPGFRRFCSEEPSSLKNSKSVAQSSYQQEVKFLIQILEGSFET